MEKTFSLQKPTSNQEIINESITLLKKGYFKYATKENLALLFAKYCMYDLNINYTNIIVDEEILNKEGYYSNNESHITKKELKGNNPTDILTTIAHELRHCYQQYNLPSKFKDFDKPIEIKYPLEDFPTIISYIALPKQINKYNYYLTSGSEHDATLFALRQTRKFLHNIEQSTTNKKILRFVKKNLKRVEKQKNKYQKKYQAALTHVLKTKHLIGYYITKEVKATILDYNKNNSSVVDYIRSLFFMYCDKSLSNQIYNLATELEDDKLLIGYINHPHTYVTEQQFLQALVQLEKNNYINISFLRKNFNNFSEISLSNMLSKFNLSKQPRTHLKSTNAYTAKQKVMVIPKSNLSRKIQKIDEKIL